MASRPHVWRLPVLSSPLISLSILAALGPGCLPPTDDGDGPDPDPVEQAVWSEAFDASGVGVLSAVWGSGPDDVFVVGGTREQGEIYHYDGSIWQAMNVPTAPLLIWVFGFGPDDVYAVGEEGGALHYDGQRWRSLQSGTNEDLWGIWGSAPEDLWIVGGDTGQGDPVILHFDGQTFTPMAPPPNDRNANALFKVWGIGSKVFAVGSNGLIIEYDGQDWLQVPTGAAADDDFVSLWGTSENNIVAVGGRSIGRLSAYDGQSWTTQGLGPAPGLNAVFMVDADEAIIGGLNGYVGSYDPLTDVLMDENAPTNQAVHGIWGDGQGRFYAVGGRFSEPFSGLALVRTLGEANGDPMPPADTPPLPQQLEIGIANGEPYRPLEDGGEMPVFGGFQGGIHIFVSFELTGFPPDAAVDITCSGRLVETDQTVIIQETLRANFIEVEPGVNQILDWLVFLDARLEDVVDREGILSFEVVSIDDPSLVASADLRVVFVDAWGN